MHTVVMAVEFETSQFDNIQMLLALIDNMATNSDRIVNGCRSVTGKPVFTQKMAEQINEELKK